MLGYDEILCILHVVHTPLFDSFCMLQSGRGVLTNGLYLASDLCTTFGSIQKFWRDACSGTISRSFWFRSISWFLFTCADPDEMSTRWPICLAVSDRACMLESQNRARCPVDHLAPGLVTYALRWSHQSARPGAFHIKGLARDCPYGRCPLYNFIRPTIFPYWLQDAFHIGLLGQELSHAGDVPSYKTWWHVKQLHAKLSTSSSSVRSVGRYKQLHARLQLRLFANANVTYQE